MSVQYGGKCGILGGPAAGMKAGANQERQDQEDCETPLKGGRCLDETLAVKVGQLLHLPSSVKNEDISPF